MSWKTNPQNSGKRAVFKRIVAGSEVHDAFMRWAETQYIKNIHFVAGLVNTTFPETNPVKTPAFHILLEKVASPLIYLEMDWHNLADREKVPFARGAYAEQFARRIQEANRTTQPATSE